MTELNIRIREARTHAKLSQVELAEMLHITDRTLKRHEKDAAKVTVELVKNMSRICGVSEIWLLTGQGDMIDGITQLKTAVNYSGIEDEIIREHIEIVHRFKDKVTAKELNYDLTRLEEIDHSALKELHEFIKVKLKMKEAVESKQQGRMGGKKAVNGH